MNIVTLNISWQLTAIIISLMFSVTIVIVVNIIMRGSNNKTNYEKLSGIDKNKGTLTNELKNDALRNNPTKYKVFIAGSCKLMDEHNIIKSTITDIVVEWNCPNYGLVFEPINYTYSYKQSEYDMIITHHDTRLFLLILDGKIDSTYEETEKEFEKALQKKDNLDIIIFERKYEESIENAVIKKILKNYKEAYNGDRYIIQYKDKEDLRSKCYEILLKEIRNIIQKRNRSFDSLM